MFVCLCLSVNEALMAVGKPFNATNEGSHEIYSPGRVPSSILSHATFPGAPSYSGVRIWVEGSQTCRDRPLAEAFNQQLGYKEYTQQDFSTYLEQ